MLLVKRNGRPESTLQVCAVERAVGPYVTVVWITLPNRNSELKTCAGFDRLSLCGAQLRASWAFFKHQHPWRKPRSTATGNGICRSSGQIDPGTGQEQEPAE